MKVRIYKISPHQTAKVFGVVVGIIMLIIAVITIVFSLASSGYSFNVSWPKYGLLITIVLAFAYGVLAYVVVFVGCLIYNRIFGEKGGIEYDVSESSL